MTTNPQTKPVPLVSINPNSLKIKENQSRTYQPIQQESPPVMIGPQLPDTKPLRKKSALPPVPRFEDSEKKNTEMEIEMNKQETLNKFLMEIKGVDFKEMIPTKMDIEERKDEKANLPNERMLDSAERNREKSGSIEIKSNESILEVSKIKLETPKDSLKQDKGDTSKEKGVDTSKEKADIPKVDTPKEKVDVPKEKMDVPKEKSNTGKTPNDEKPVFQKPDFKLNLDLINNMYKQQINPKKDNPTPKKNEVSVSSVSNEKVLIPLMKKENLIPCNKQNEEYDPAKPNDYESLVHERAEKERKQRETEKKAKMEIEEPKESFKDSRENFQLNSNNNNNFSNKNPNFRQNNKLVSPKKEIPMTEKEISNEEKIIKMMEKSGWKFGQGLGKNEQGMTTPLITKKTTSNTAIIVNSTVEMASVLPQEIVMRKKLEVQNIQVTRILLLKNMVTLEMVDDALKEEVAEECEKYGKVMSCVVFLMKNANTEEDAVRIFVEFDKKESAMRAYSSINGRFFAGRTVAAKFYDEKNYFAAKYDI